MDLQASLTCAMLWTPGSWWESWRKLLGCQLPLHLNMSALQVCIQVKLMSCRVSWKGLEFLSFFTFQELQLAWLWAKMKPRCVWWMTCSRISPLSPLHTPEPEVKILSMHLNFSNKNRRINHQVCSLACLTLKCGKIWKTSCRFWQDVLLWRLHCFVWHLRRPYCQDHLQRGLRTFWIASKSSY